MKIIFAQGNPGLGYINSRHNLGFVVLNKIAKNYKVSWQKNTKFDAHIAEILNPNEKVLLVKPDTFYNNTGSSMRSLVDFYKLTPSEDILVIHDELMLPLGTVRVRSDGSDAGNNGIKSLNAHIGENFHRIRVGIETELKAKMDAEKFVLGNFSGEEKTFLNKEIIPYIAMTVEDFIAGNILHGNKHFEK